MIRVFVSQPMRGLSDEQIEKARDEAVYSVIDNLGVKIEDIEVIDSVLKNFSSDTHPLGYLGASIALMAGADVVYFAPGWENARGCKVENLAALLYEKNVIESFKKKGE